MIRTLIFVFVCSIAMLAQPLVAQTVELVATQDVTLYETETTDGDLANGAGAFLYSGTTGQQANGIRRLLLSFDLSSIPEESAISAAELSLTVSKSAGFNETNYNLHRVLSDWGEGPTDASTLGEGQGIEALDGEATWHDTFSPGQPWNTPGGDFVSGVSASTAISFEDRYTWSGNGLLDDVQMWLEQPEQNFGWILIGDESVPRTARQFNSRTNAVIDARPTLTVTFSGPVTQAGDCNGDGVVDLADLDCGCSGGGEPIESVLEALGVLRGDANADGDVLVDDFLVLSRNFGMSATYTQGDFNCDGSVDVNDFLILSRNFGQPAVASMAAVVPEPGANEIVVFGLVFVAAWTLQRREFADAVVKQIQG